jgi:predicted ABC-type ATPase
MPFLYILAGPNGTGKTTYYTTALSKVLIEKQLPFLNIDLITKDLGGYSVENFAMAELINRDKITSIIKDKNDFMIESNLAKSSDYEWIEKMVKAGYEVILYFLCNDDININTNRVQQRVMEGGHNIPVEIIRHRYKMTLAYLKGKLHLFTEVYFIDNSTDEAVIKAVIKDGILNEFDNENTIWVNDILSLYKRIKR